jgi:hypothetical protein
MPGRKWYVVAAVIFFVGLAVFGTFLFLRIRGLSEGFQQVVVPGSAEIVVDETGRWTIYQETGSSFGGVVYGTADLTGLEIEVFSPSGQSLALTPPGMSESYEIGGRRGYAIFRFEAPEAGTYRIVAGYPGRPGASGVLTVGRGFTLGILWTVFGAIGIAMAATTLALLIAVVTFIKRYRAKRRLAAQAAAPPPTNAG